MKRKSAKPPFYRRKSFRRSIGVLVALAVIVSLAFRLSPWPGALVVRAVFDQGSRKTLAALESHKPDVPVAVTADQRYQEGGGGDTLLDVYVPESAVREGRKLPVVVWTHGGGWLSGDKADAAPYYKLLAGRGFTVVAVNYSLAPGKTYPTQVRQLNEAHAYIEANADRFHADTDKVVLAGDSAGSQLSGQLAALITNPDYAEEVGIRPALSPSQLAGVVLFCGIYKMEGLTHPDPTLPKIVSWGSDVTVWAYSGTRDKSGPLIRQLSPYYHVTKDFPAAFISGGNGDPLTDAQSKPFADKLKSLDVGVTTLFYPADHTPKLPHEYQFTLDKDGERAFGDMVRFLRERT